MRASAVACLVALLVLGTLSACGSSDDDGSAATGATPTQASKPASGAEDVKTSIVLHLRVPAVETFGYGALAAGEELGFDVNVVGPQQANNLEQQKIAQAEVDAGSQGLALLLLGAESWRRPIEKWQRGGIRVVTTGIQTGEFMGAETPLLIAPRDVRTGRMLAEMTLEGLGEDPSGEIVVGTSVPGLKLLEDRIEGFRAVMAERAPNVKVSVFQAADDNVEGVTDWQALVRAHSDAIAFVGLASTAPAILGKIKKDSRADWLVTGCELDPRTLPLIKGGSIYGVTSANFWVEGYMSARVLYEQIAHDRYTDLHGWIDSGTEIVTQENIDEIIERESSPEAMAEYYLPRVNRQFEDLESYLGPY